MRRLGGGSHPSHYSDSEVRHIQSQGSLPALGKDKPLLSALAKKLRLERSHRVAILNAPPGYLDSLAPGPFDIRTELQTTERFDAVQLFVSGEEELRSLGSAAIRAVRPDGLLWVTYPKGQSGKTPGSLTCRRRRGGSSRTCLAKSRPKLDTSPW